MGLCGRQLSLIARGLTLAASPPQRLEQVGGLAERLLGLIGALDRGSRSGRTRDLRRARVRKRLEVRRRVGIAALVLIEREGAAVEARLVGVGADGAQPRDETALQLTLLRERDRLGVERLQGLLAWFEAPARIVIDRVGGEFELDDPAALVVLPTRPSFALGAELREPRSSAPMSPSSRSARPPTCSRRCGADAASVRPRAMRLS